MMKKIILWIVFATGIAVLFSALSLLSESREALKWPQTKGQVISSVLTIGHLPDFMGLKFDPVRWYGTDVQYEYSVGDGRYASNRVSFQEGATRDPKDALKVMNKYRRQHQVMVYYDPAHPQRSVLEPANIGDILTPLVAGGLLAFLGLFFLYSKSLEINRDALSYLYQGQIYQDQKKWDEALREYSGFIKIDPHIAVGYINRGNVYVQKKDWDKAIADLTQALAIDPGDASVRAALAEAVKNLTSSRECVKL